MLPDGTIVREPRYVPVLAARVPGRRNAGRAHRPATDVCMQKPLKINFLWGLCMAGAVFFMFR